MLLGTARVLSCSGMRSVVAKAPRTRVFSRVTRRKTRRARNSCTLRRQHAKTRGLNGIGDLAKTRVFRVRTLFRRVSRSVFRACKIGLQQGVAKCRANAALWDTCIKHVFSSSERCFWVFSGASLQHFLTRAHRGCRKRCIGSVSQMRASWVVFGGTHLCASPALRSPTREPLNKFRFLWSDRVNNDGCWIA